MSDVIEVIVTGPPEFIPELVETLVSERLIACGQMTSIESTYRWQGAIEHAAEVRAVMHTTKEHTASVMQRIRDVHPYEVPCILIVPILTGDAAYAAWTAAETQPRP